jgi:hypothetical protein
VVSGVCGGNGEAGRVDSSVGSQVRRSERIRDAWRGFERVGSSLYLGSFLTRVMQQKLKDGISNR